MTDTLRMLIPLWQGGNNPNYYFGAQLLDWLAPESETSVRVEVPIEPYDGRELTLEDGVAGRSVVMRQLEKATACIKEHQPKRIVVFGGDCLVSQPSFAYLNELYDGKLGVLWIDAHPDISTPAMHHHEHAMVLGNLLGHGDKEFAAKVSIPLVPENVLYAGLGETTEAESVVVEELGLKGVSAEALATSHVTVANWIEERGIEHVAIHLDLDVLDPRFFRAILPCEPGAGEFGAATGSMTLDGVAQLIQTVDAQADLVGLSIAEHLPWDAINLKNFLSSLPLLA